MRQDFCIKWLKGKMGITGNLPTPGVVYLAEEDLINVYRKIILMVCGKYGSRGYFQLLLEQAGDVEAFYHAPNGTVYINPNAPPYLLAHELCHFIQHHTYPRKNWNRSVKEAEARRLERLFAEEHGFPIPQRLW